MSSQDRLKRALIETLLGSHGPVIGTFTPGEWEAIDRFAMQHRLRPMLHRLYTASARDQASERGGRWNVPDQVALVWRETHGRAAHRYLRHLSAMAEIAGTLETAGIAYAFLKGSALTTGLYPDPATRPLRDLDILVMPDQTGKADELLRARLGYIPKPSDQGLIPEDFSRHKHIHPLLCPRRRVLVEIHHRLADRRQPEGGEDILFDARRLLDATRSGQVGKTAVRFLDWPETLLHLVAHAVHDHQLNVGPLVLCDVQHIVTTADVDLDRFRSLAEQAGRSAAAQLVFAMLSRFSGQPVPREVAAMTAPALPDEIVEAAALTLLQDRLKGLGVGTWSRLLGARSLTGAMALVSERWAGLRRTRHNTGSGHRDARLSFWKRGMAMVGGLLDADDRLAIKRSKAVSDWLNRPS